LEQVAGAELLPPGNLGNRGGACLAAVVVGRLRTVGLGNADVDRVLSDVLSCPLESRPHPLDELVVPARRDLDLHATVSVTGVAAMPRSCATMGALPALTPLATPRRSTVA